MKCMDALMILETIADMGTDDPPSSHVKDLVDLKLIDPVKVVEMASDKELALLRDRIRGLEGDRARIVLMLGNKESGSSSFLPEKLRKKDREYSALLKDLERTDTELRGCRKKLVPLVQGTTENRYRGILCGKGYHLTYRGREVLNMLVQRGARISDLELTRFLKDVSEIRDHFEKTSKRASEILKILSPSLQGTEEIHLRLASVGLSGREGSPSKTSQVFLQALKGLEGPFGNKDPSKIVLAETLSLTVKNKRDLESQISKANQLLGWPWDGYNVREDQMRAIGLIVACGEDPVEMAHKTIEITSNLKNKWYSPAALIACTRCKEENQEVPIEWNYMYFLQSNDLKRNEIEDNMAAAIMATTGLEPDMLLDRYRQANAMFKTLGMKDMEVASAMVAILPFDVDESMDNIRMAAASIAQNKLSLGGVENLSLGMKLIMQSGALSAGKKGKSGDWKLPGKKQALDPIRTSAPAVLALSGVTMGTAVALTAGLTAFHELALHSMAVRDYRFHPVHSHYVYG